MRTIEIDWDVYKALVNLREQEEMTDNDVLRNLLKLSPKVGAVGLSNSAAGQGYWISKGVRFPVGTAFRATYRGQIYHGRVESGGLVVDGKSFSSPSAAAVAITKNPVNGWTFWECKLAGSEAWTMIKSLRR